MTERGNRPTEGAVHEVPAKGPTDSLAESDLTFEDRHAAYLVGFGDGMNHRLRLEAEDRARALLATWANESQTMATRYARAKGPNWAAFFGESDD